MPGKVALKDCMLAPSVDRVTRIEGLRETIARLSGEPKAASSRVGFRTGCEGVVARHPRPQGPAIFVRARDRTAFAHAVADDPSAILVAHAVMDGLRLPARIMGPLLRQRVRKEGFTALGHRKLHRDPIENAHRVACVETFMADWLPRLLLGAPGGTWTTAIVWPGTLHADGVPERRSILIVHTPKRVLVTRFGHDLRRLDDAASCGLVTLAVHEASVGRGLARLSDIPVTGCGGVVEAASLSGLPPDLFDPNHRAEPAPRWKLKMPGPTDPFEVTDDIVDDGCQGEGKFRWPPLEYVARLGVAKGHAGTLAAFKRRLPPEVASTLGLSGKVTEDAADASRWFLDRARWTREDYRRLAQALLMVPALTGFAGKTHVTDAIREGREMRHVLALAFNDGAPVARKMVACLVDGALAHNHLARRGGNEDVRRMALTLDALYRREPHHPVMGERDLAAVASLSSVEWIRGWEPPLIAVFALAHRTARGRFGKAVAGLSDTVKWIERTSLALLGTEPNQDVDARLARAVSAHVAFPTHRRHASLRTLDAEWHRRIGGLLAREAAFLRSAQDRTAREAGSGKVAWFPHFMTKAVSDAGVVLVPLLSEDAILAEGEALQHCVGTYGRSARVGVSMLVGISSQEGRSTAEIRLMGGDGGNPFLDTTQVRGPRNAVPPRAHVDALERAMRKHSRRRLIALSGRISVALRLRDELGEPRLDEAQETELANIRFEALRPFLWGPMRTMDRTGWTSSMRAAFGDPAGAHRAT